MSRMQDMCDIQCDACCNWQPGVYPDTREQRNLLRRLGWTYVKSLEGPHMDLCPECAAKQQTNKETT